MARVPVLIFRLAGPEDRPVIESRVIYQGWPMTGAAAGGAAGAAAAAAAGAGAAAAGGGRRRQQTPRTPSPRRRRRSSCACWPRAQSSTTRSATQVMQPRRGGQAGPGHDRVPALAPCAPAPLAALNQTPGCPAESGVEPLDDAGAGSPERRLRLADWRDLGRLLAWFREGCSACAAAELAFSPALSKEHRAQARPGAALAPPPTLLRAPPRRPKPARAAAGARGGERGGPGRPADRQPRARRGALRVRRAAGGARRRAAAGARPRPHAAPTAPRSLPQCVPLIAKEERRKHACARARSRS